MTVILTPNGFKKAYTGTLRLKFDGGSTIYAFPNSRVDVVTDEGESIPDVMDSAQEAQNRVLGMVTGQISARGAVKLDRGFDTFLTGAFGPRSSGGKLTPMIATIVPATGSAAETFVGVWWDTLTLTATFGTSGQVLMVTYEMTGYVLDPKNVFAAAALAAGVNEGVAGVGLSTFGNSKVTNGASVSPTTYDGVRRFTATFSNRMTPDPAPYPGHEADRIIAGYTPSSFMGGAAFAQLQGCAQPLPYSGANNPVTLKIPSGDGSTTATLDLSLSYRGKGESFDPSDYNTNTTRYSMFSSSGTNGTGAANSGAGYAFAISVA